MLKLGTVALVAFFSLSPPVGQDVAALKREIEQLKAQQAEMKRDLDAIKSFPAPYPLSPESGNGLRLTPVPGGNSFAPRTPAGPSSRKGG